MHWTGSRVTLVVSSGVKHMVSCSSELSLQAFACSLVILALLPTVHTTSAPCERRWIMTYFDLVPRRCRTSNRMSTPLRGAMIRGPKRLGEYRWRSRTCLIVRNTPTDKLEKCRVRIVEVYHNGRAFIGVCGLRGKSASYGSLTFEQVRAVPCYDTLVHYRRYTRASSDGRSLPTPIRLRTVACININTDERTYRIPITPHCHRAH